MSELQESYAWCHKLCWRSKSSFYRSFALLQPTRRRALYALYAFARISDDLADAPLELQQKTQLLTAWRKRLGHLGQAEGSAISMAEDYPDDLRMYEPVWTALQDTARRFQIPLSLFDDIVHGVSMDLTPNLRFSTWEEQQEYCYYVASAVGLACTHIWKAEQQVPEPAAIACGQAFQLTNILRDVAEDARLGRLYLPLTLLKDYGVEEQAWLAEQPDGDWRGLFEEVGNRALALYEEGWETIERITPDSQKMFSLMWRSYYSLLEKVLKHREELWNGGRIQLATSSKALLVLGHVVPGLYPLMFSKPRNFSSKNFDKRLW